MERKEQMQTAPAGRVSQQAESQKGGGAMRNLMTAGGVAIEFIHLYDSDLPSVPWKFLIEDRDWFWPVGWVLHPTGDGELWLVKRESPRNIHAKESYDLVGIKVNGELVFVEPEWNNEVLQVWSREEVLSLFEDVVRGEYSGVAIWENWSPEEREKVEKWNKLMQVVKTLLEDGDLRYGEFTFLKYAERYYSEWLAEFQDLFRKIAKMEEGRITFLKGLKRSLWKEGFRNGYFMYICYP
jgi:hypothetical protein